MMNKEQSYELRYLKVFEKYGYRPHQKIMSFGSIDYTPHQFAKRAIRNQEYELYILENSRSKEEFDEYVTHCIQCEIHWYEKEDRAIIHAKLINDYETATKWEKKKKKTDILQTICGAIIMIPIIGSALAIAFTIAISLLKF